MERPTEIWLSGDELIHFVSDLLEPKGDDEERRTGRSSKLALHYALLLLKAPGNRVMIRDHFDSPESNRSLMRTVCSILELLGIDYGLGQIQVGEADPGSFTGVRVTGTLPYIVAHPKLST